MNPNSNLYATDEDVALRAPADFPLLCPPGQVQAAGTDGCFQAGDRWTLTSAAVPSGPSTPSSILRTCSAVLALITRCPRGSWTFSSPTRLTSCGGRSTPSVAIAA